MKILTLSITLALAAALMFHRQAGSDPRPTNLKSDEELVFYPTYGRLDSETNQWRVSIRGKVFEPEDGSIKRRLFVAWLKSALDDGVDGDQLRDDRVRPFLVDNERGKSVTIELADQHRSVGTSAGNGHFGQQLEIDREQFELTTSKPHVVEYQAVLRERDTRTFRGRVHLLSATGVSVISDLDDTIKDSQVTDKSELLRNTFMREFKPVTGMPQVYQRLAESGVAFHYVSGSPWQLYRPLETFLESSQFPKGTMHLKHFRLKDSSALDLLGSQRETKLAAITPLLEDFPSRRFILIGDSGEQDPEIYGQLAREYSDQIAAVFIRNVTSAKRNNDRFTEAFRDVPEQHWMLFDDSEQLRQSLLQLPFDGFDKLQQ